MNIMICIHSSPDYGSQIVPKSKKNKKQLEIRNV